VQAFERERRTGTVADESLDARPVLGLDAHGGVDAEPARALAEAYSVLRHASQLFDTE